MQYALCAGATAIGIDTGTSKRDLVTSFGAHFLDYQTTDLLAATQDLTSGRGLDAVIVTAGSSAAFATAASLLKPEGRLCCVGIPPGGGRFETSVAEVVIKGLQIKGNLVGNLKECLEAVELVRTGKVKPRVFVRPFHDLPKVYAQLEKGDIAGRVVLKVGDDPGPNVGIDSKL